VTIAYPFVGISFLISAALAVSFLGEPLTRPMVIGTLLIVGALWCWRADSRARRRAPVFGAPGS